MKKLLLILIAFSLTFTFTSCEKEEVDPSITSAVTSSGTSVTPVNDTVILSIYTAGNFGNSWVCENDGQILQSEISHMSVSPNGNNYCTGYARQWDLDNDGLHDEYTGKISIEQPDFGENGMGVTFTEYFTVNITLTSGYSYSTTLVVIQKE